MNVFAVCEDGHFNFGVDVMPGFRSTFSLMSESGCRPKVDHSSLDRGGPDACHVCVRRVARGSSIRVWARDSARSTACPLPTRRSCAVFLRGMHGYRTLPGLRERVSKMAP